MKTERKIRKILAEIGRVNNYYNNFYNNSLTEWEKEGVEHCRNVDINNTLEGMTDEDMDFLNKIKNNKK